MCINASLLDILCFSEAGMPAAAADTTDEALDMRRECRRRRRLISDAVGDPTAIGISVDLLITAGFGLAVCDCTSTMAQWFTVVTMCSARTFVHRSLSPSRKDSSHESFATLFRNFSGSAGDDDD